MQIPPALRRKDTVGALLLMALGIAVALAGWHYRVGTLRNMGAGYAPVVLGVALIAAGALIAALSAPAPPTGVDAARHRAGVDARAWVGILAGVGAFVLFARYGGLVPAAFGCVFASALGDRANSLRDALALACALALAGYLVFSVALGLPLAPFSWGG